MPDDDGRRKILDRANRLLKQSKDLRKISNELLQESKDIRTAIVKRKPRKRR